MTSRKLAQAFFLALLLTLTTQAQTRNINHAVDGSNIPSASSTYSPAFSEDRAIDGDRIQPGWADQTRSVFPDTLTVTFPRRLSLSRIIVVTRQDATTPTTEPTPTQTCTSYGIKDFDVQVLNESNSWQTVASVVGNTLCIREFTFPAIRSGAFRVVVNSSWDGLFSRIAELESYSQ